MTNWPLVSLGEIFEIARGGSPRPIQDFITEEPDGVNWIMIGDASDNSKYITSTRKRILKSGVSKSRMVYPGDFLLTNSMSFGHPYILKTTGCIHDGWLVLSNKDSAVDQDYFYYLLGSETVYSEFSRRASGTTVKNLNIDLVSGVKVALPPLEEQRRIAAVLNKADEVRRKRRDAIRLTEELLRSTFLEMFGDPVTNSRSWDRAALGSLLTFLTSGSRGWAQYYADEGSLFIRIQNVKEGRLLLDDTAFVKAPESAEARRTAVQEGDVLVSITADLGRTAVVPKGLGSAHINQHLALLRLNQEYVSPTYIAAFLASSGGQTQFDRLNREGVKAGLNFDDLRGINVLCPPVEMQRKYEAFFGSQTCALERQKTAHNASIDLFNSLLQRAFRGEL